MEAIESKIIETDGTVVQYQEGNRVRQALWETDLTNAELRLFSYFLLRSYNLVILKLEKEKQFKQILEKGIIPETIGYITRHGNVFCIQKADENLFHFYMGGDDDVGFNRGIKKILKRIGK